MDVNKELDRIRGHGWLITIYWGSSITFSKKKPHEREHIGEGSHDVLYRQKKYNEKWEHCLYCAIIDFDEWEAENYLEE